MAVICTKQGAFVLDLTAVIKLGVKCYDFKL